MCIDVQGTGKVVVPVASVCVVQDREEAEKMALVQELEQRPLVEIEREED